ncbi:hypothetical protein DOTSEDRAFT_69676 [Dothistroma septosporum NZE10]|uniref:Rhodopsin domain-containing protein n=1 Tax=Dothistroma septosporum (strain NZE10 / CBS 128990) TaxID=675120 RepID=N1PZJ6_DOTSN|nr:hypothetical protein DOTSEDRAFT_69676 [Dothistroma septosporum NZE10]
MSSGAPSTDALFREVWTEYGISICLILLRFYARLKFFGIRNLDIGDAFAALALIFYTLETAGIYNLTQLSNNVGLNEVTAMLVPDSQIPAMTLGSKLAFMNWIWYISLIWALKGVLLTIYVKLGTGVARQEMAVKIFSVFTFCTWLACILTHVCQCLPASRSWQIKPYPGDNCTLRKPNYIVIGVLNSLTDLGIIILPMPLLFRVKVPVKQKIALIVLFSLGFFVIVATILRAYYSLESLDTLIIALGWASRETFVATVVACAPGIKPLISKTHWFRSASSHSGNKGSHDPSKYFSFSRRSPKGEIGGSGIVVSRSVDVYHERSRDREPDFEMMKWKTGRYPSSEGSDERVMISAEQEQPKGDDRSAIYTTEQMVRAQDHV